MRKGSTIAKYIEKDFIKEKNWKDWAERENTLRKVNVNTDKMIILGENARNTLILEK